MKPPQNRRRSTVFDAVFLGLAMAAPQHIMAQSVNFSQSGGTVTLRNITQSGSADHNISGIGTNGLADPTAPARFAGDFSSLVLKQSGSGAARFAMDIDVAQPSRLSFQMASEGQLLAQVVAGKFDSNIAVTGEGAKTLDIRVAAPDAAINQDITLSGGAINFWLTQTNSATLRLDYMAMGSTAAEVQITQSGLNTIADVTGAGDSGSLLALNLQGDATSAYLDATLGINSHLTYEFNRENSSIGEALAPVRVTVPDNQAVTVRFN